MYGPANHWYPAVWATNRYTTIKNYCRLLNRHVKSFEERTLVEILAIVTWNVLANILVAAVRNGKRWRENIFRSSHKISLSPQYSEL